MIQNSGLIGERLSRALLIAIFSLMLALPAGIAGAAVTESASLPATDGRSAALPPASESDSGDTAPGTVEAWKVGLGKTFTYRIAASIDALVVGYLYTGSLLGGGGIALFNAVVSSTLYDLHEMGWSSYGPHPEDVDPVELGLWKTVSYRCISVANVLATGLFFTGNFWLSSGLALGNAVIDSTIYFFHELAWSTWGPPVQREHPAPAMAGKEG